MGLPRSSSTTGTFALPSSLQPIRRSWSFNLPFSHILLLLIRANDEISLNVRARIISPDESDATQIRTPKVASFLQDVALRDLAVHAAHAACVDGRGDVYQWGDGFFAAERSASGDGKPVLTLRGKVRIATLPPFKRK